MDNFYLWYSGKKFNPHDVLFDIGITTSVAINNYVHGKDINSCGCSGYYDNGNGSLMRILPLSYYFIENEFTDKEMSVIVNKVSSLTHAHSISCLGCYLYTRFIMFLLSGMNVKDSYLSLGKLDLSMYDLDTVSVYKRFLDGELCNLSVDKIKSSGFVVSTLEASIWCNLTSSNYSEVVLKAVNLGDDTDTVSALAGAVAGISYGVDSIPKNWLDSLVKKDYLEDLSKTYEEVIGKYKVKVKE
jgi:ADP-ribosylglycohydrolase